jgi:hypothetical protein
VRRTIAVFAVVVGVLSLGQAHAATILEFKPLSAVPGDQVGGTTVGAGMQGIPSGRVIVLLAPSNQVADAAKGPSDPSLVRFGVMRADGADVGHFSGRVPDVKPGSYIAVAYCRECATGGTVFTVGEFEVAGGALPSTGVAVAVWVFLGVLMVLVGGCVLTWHRGSKR